MGKCTKPRLNTLYIKKDETQIRPCIQLSDVKKKKMSGKKIKVSGMSEKKIV